MRTVLAIAAMVMAGSAAAQTGWGPPPPSPSRLPGISPTIVASPILRDTQRIRRDARRGREQQTLTRAEARGLRREARQVDALADRYGKDGLSASERMELETRARVLQENANARRTAGLGRAR